jgi:FixJ family two-component response regulator
MECSGMAAKPLIAIVDDDETACEGTIDLVKSMGFTAKGSRCAEDFLKSSYLAETSLLITDVRMPGMSGLELHSHLLQSGKPIPTIVVTAFPNDRDRARALKAGVICYLAKPFNDAELLGCVRSALDSSPGGDL